MPKFFKSRKSNQPFCLRGRSVLVAFSAFIFLIQIRSISNHIALSNVLSRQAFEPTVPTSLHYIVSTQPLGRIIHNLSIPLPLPTVPPNRAEKQLDALLARLPHPVNYNPPASGNLILFRALGSDTPPRHASNQTLDNLVRVLRYEHVPPGVERRWFLNQILNTSAELAIARELVAYNETFFIDRFYPDRILATRHNLENFHSHDLQSALYANESLFDHMTVKKWHLELQKVFNEQNLAVIRNNEVRNRMLQLGFDAGARFVTPCDGSVFVPRNAWQGILAGLNDSWRIGSNAERWEEAQDVTEFPLRRILSSYVRKSLLQMQPPHLQTHIGSGSKITRLPYMPPTSPYYFIVPMFRAYADDSYLNNSFLPPNVNDEPQIIFRNDSLSRFDERFPYSCAPKVELLYRLNVPGIWNKEKHNPQRCLPDWRNQRDSELAPRSVGFSVRMRAASEDLDKPNAMRTIARVKTIERLSADAHFRALELKGRPFSPRRSLLLYDTRRLKTLQALLRRATFISSERSSSSSHAPSSTLTVGEEMYIRALFAEATQAESKTRLLSSSSLPAATKARIATRAAIAAALSAALSGRAELLRKGVIALIRGANAAQREGRCDAERAAAQGVTLCIALDAARLLDAGTTGTGLYVKDGEDAIRLVSNWARRWRECAGVTPPSDRRGHARWEVGSACAAAWEGDLSVVIRRTALATGWLQENWLGREGWWWSSPFGLVGARSTAVAWSVLGVVGDRVGVDVWGRGADEGKSVNRGGAHIPALERAARRWGEALGTSSRPNDIPAGGGSKSEEGSEAGRWLGWVGRTKYGMGTGLWGERRWLGGWSDDDDDVIPFWELGA